MTDIAERLRECALNHARGSWSWPEEKADPMTATLCEQAAALTAAALRARARETP